MTRISAEGVITKLMLYLTLAVPFGVATGALQIQSSLTTIFNPWPNFNQIVGGAVSGASKSCGAWDFGCQASAGIATATAYVGAVLSFPGQLMFSFATRINAIGNLGNQIIFGTSGSLNAIPGLNFVILIFVIIAVIEFIRIFRGSSVGI